VLLAAADALVCLLLAQEPIPVMQVLEVLLAVA